MLVDTSSNDTLGEIKFVRPQSWPEEEKPYILTYLPNDDLSLSNFDYDDIHKVQIRDMRPIKEQLSLDREGFEVADFESSLAYNEYFDEEKLRTVFASELRAYLTATYGLSAVYIHECVIRKRGSTPDMGKGYGQPIQEAHTDYTIDYIRRLIPQLTKDTGEQVLSRKFRMVNLWKPLRGPLRDWPLALCDYSSVSPADMIRVDEVHKEDILESHGVQYSSSQRWYYLPDMLPSEMLVFKSADSHVKGEVPHSAFKDLKYESEQPRESIELRVLMVW